MVMHMKMPPTAARAMPTASTAYRDAEPERSKLGKAALMFLMQAPPVVVLHLTHCVMLECNLLCSHTKLPCTQLYIHSHVYIALLKHPTYAHTYTLYTTNHCIIGLVQFTTYPVLKPITRYNYINTTYD